MGIAQNRTSQAGKSLFLPRLVLFPKQCLHRDTQCLGRFEDDFAPNQRHLSPGTDGAPCELLATNSLPASLDEMMLKEKLHVFQVVSEKTGTDAVLTTTPADMKDDSRFFSFKQAADTFTAQVQIYSRAKDDFV